MYSMHSEIYFHLTYACFLILVFFKMLHTDNSKIRQIQGYIANTLGAQPGMLFSSDKQ